MSLITVTQPNDFEERLRLLPAPPLTHIIDTQVNGDARTVYMDDIEAETGQWLAMVMGDLVTRDSTRPISIMLNTPGGDVVSMFAIHDLIRTSSVPIHVHAYGQCCSAGVLILASGHKRTVSESCMWMSHEPWGFGGSDLGMAAAKSRRKADDWMHSHWCHLMGKLTPHGAAYWDEKTKNEAEYWLLGGTAIVAAGVADSVVD